MYVSKCSLNMEILSWKESSFSPLSNVQVGSKITAAGSSPS